MVWFHRRIGLRLMWASALRAATANKPTPPPPFANPDFANVKLLIMNGDGSDGNQDMTDMSLDSRVATYLSGILMSDVDEKFSGSPVLNFPVGANDGLTFPSSFPQFTGDFTIETWIRPHATPTNDPARLLAKWGSNGQRAWRLERATNGKINWVKSVNGSVNDLFMTTTLTAPVETWSYVVTQREGNNFTIWVKGIKDSTVVSTTGIHAGGGEALRVGIQSTSASEYRGRMGPTRITVGQALFPGAPNNIVVPSSPFPVDILELESTANRLELEATTDNILLEDSSGILVLQDTGNAITLEDGTGRLALD